MPTLVTVTQLTATLRQDWETILIHWSTTTEENTLGFHIFAGPDNRFASARQINTQMLLGRSSFGGNYTYHIPTERLATEQFIWLVETKVSDTQNRYGSILLQGIEQIFLPLLTSRLQHRNTTP